MSTGTTIIRNCLVAFVLLASVHGQTDITIEDINDELDIQGGDSANDESAGDPDSDAQLEELGGVFPKEQQSIGSEDEEPSIVTEKALDAIPVDSLKSNSEDLNQQIEAENSGSQNGQGEVVPLGLVPEGSIAKSEPRNDTQGSVPQNVPGGMGSDEGQYGPGPGGFRPPYGDGGDRWQGHGVNWGHGGYGGRRYHGHNHHYGNHGPHGPHRHGPPVPEPL